MTDTYLLAMRCPVYRGCDSNLGYGAEPGNPLGEVKGKGTIGGPREAERTDAPSQGRTTP
jgi:hypothetical protein